ncbi:F-box/kelch-repeat protein OR23-like [Bidens hawaiensis]|uniref:F-box/kelch-repeat protein OR23-like n=1 Tax=Bidens hawaiensis TaxID=980011 RepID=UPI00404A6ED2
MNNLTLIPGLPDDLSSLILSFLPYSHHSRLRSTCKLWNHFFSSKTLISFRRNHLLIIFPDDPTICSPYIFDPQTLAWANLPPMPCNPHVYGLCNFTSVSHDSCVYVIGGSLFDTRSFPLDRPSSSASGFRFDFVSDNWEPISPMVTPRGSFAAAVTNSNKIIVAGGGSRHNMFAAAGSRLSSVEVYDIGSDQWVGVDGLPRFRAGCVGFVVGNDNNSDKEFWVMGGYGESRTVLGVFPVDEYYSDAVVMEMKNGVMGKWREIGNMWEEGERRKLGRIAVVDDGNGGFPGVFMLDKSDIFRYERASNRWKKETSIPKKLTDESSVGFVSLNGELHVMGYASGGDATENHKSRQLNRSGSLLLQIYHPQSMIWRTLITKTPFVQPLDFKTAVMCTIRL